MSKRSVRARTTPLVASKPERKPPAADAASSRTALPPNTGTESKERVKTARNKGLRFPEMHAALGDVLRAYRKQGKLSQSDISLDADLDRAYISRIERAEQSPTIATLIAIETRLGIPAWQLLKEAEERVKEKNL